MYLFKKNQNSVLNGTDTELQYFYVQADTSFFLLQYPTLILANAMNPHCTYIKRILKEICLTYTSFSFNIKCI